MDRPLFIGIAGGSGSGKTTLARRLRDEVDAERIALISMDRYFRTEASSEPGEVNFDHPAHLDLDLLAHHLSELRGGRPVSIPDYDYLAMRQTPAVETVEPRQVVIVEGLFVLARPIVDHFDLTCFLDVELDQRLIGRILRDRAERGASIEETVDRYQRFVRPSYQVFVAPTKQNADIVVDFTYRRAFFTETLIQLVRDFVESRVTADDFVGRVRSEPYGVGYRPDESVMPMTIDIRQLARAFPEAVTPVSNPFDGHARQ